MNIFPGEEGEIIAGWRAGCSYLFIEIGDYGTSFTYADSTGNLVENIVTDEPLDTEIIKRRLAELTLSMSRR